ncbi:hypothetical protein [Salmonirosea aquatica]|uniref:hypothetical protein n=1 Tax=Salmonirosea aquatica TaxID=2654236 RepID=UPI003570F0A2
MASNPYNNTESAMEPSRTTAQYSVQKTPLDQKVKISTAEPFEELIRKYCYVKMLS